MEFLMMKRREFIIAARRRAWLLAEHAPPGHDRVPQGAPPWPFAYPVAAFRQEQPEMDEVDDPHVAIKYRRAEGQGDGFRRSRRKAGVPS